MTFSHYCPPTTLETTYCDVQNELSDKLRRSLWKHWGRLTDKYGNLCIEVISKIPASDLPCMLRTGKLTQSHHRFANHVLQADQAVRHSSRHTVNVIVSAMKQGFSSLQQISLDHLLHVLPCRA